MQAIKTVILPVKSSPMGQVSHQISATPSSRLHKPKNRNWPSLSLRIWAKVWRQVPGDTKGMKPSITSTSAIASQKVVLSKQKPGSYFLGLAARPPRMVLKNSELDGSSTITSPFLENDVL